MAAKGLILVLLFLTSGEVRNSAVAAPVKSPQIFSVNEENPDKSCDRGRSIIIGIPDSGEHNSRHFNFYNIQLAVYSRKSLSRSFHYKLLESETTIKSPLVKILRL